ncbi:PREDICTED: vegetative cell wall protein gp1-like [Vollenhovia emeryi]|uniref:vegetative cell wall protein gp1-like n=1 Tax=Vollenhovia emeryi TaxID=411798 RepID=UPI0005F56391|nr:PREDICTED: vegetative cell wall protein gp1-like [Vollenhovia emeryi]
MLPAGTPRNGQIAPSWTQSPAPPTSESQPPLPPRPRAPDPCPVRAWAPRPPVTPAPRAAKAALAAVLSTPALRLEKRPPPGQQAPKAQPTTKRTKPCVVRIEALPQKVRLVRRPRKPLRPTQDMPLLV